MTTALWMGPAQTEARSAYHRARMAGLSPLRALVVGSIASFKDCWAFRGAIAAHVGCSIRTVQRAITQAKGEGLIEVHRAKQREKPPGLGHEVPCGWSHRWTIGWGKAGELVQRAVSAARAKWIALHIPAPRATEKKTGRIVSGPLRITGRRWTPEEIDAELERTAIRGIPAEPDTPPE